MQKRQILATDSSTRIKYLDHNTKDITRQSLTTVTAATQFQRVMWGEIFFLETGDLCQASEDRPNLEIKRGGYTEIVLSCVKDQRRLEVWEKITLAALERSGCRGMREGQAVRRRLHVPAARAENH